METKNIGFTLFALALLLFALPVISAAPTVTINTPAADSTGLSGTNTFNVTINGIDVPTLNHVNLSIYAKSLLTANSSWGLLTQNNSLNMTAVAESTTSTNFTLSIATLLGLEDANDYIFNATLFNASDGVVLAGDTNTGIEIDQSVPTTPSALSISGEQTTQTPTFSATVVGTNTTSCTLQFPDKNPGQTSYAMTHTSDSCSYTFTADIAEQTYEYFIRASDETNTTDSSRQTFSIAVNGGKGSASPEVIEDFEGKETKNNTIFYLLIGVIIFIGIIWLANKK